MNMHVLAKLAQDHIGDAPQVTTAVKGLDLFQGEASTQWAPVLYEPSICVLLKGRKEVMIGRKIHEYGPNNFALVWVDLPLLCRVREPYIGLQLRLDPLIVSEVLTDAAPQTTSNSLAGWALAPLTPAFIEALKRLLWLFDAPHEIEALAPLIIREIVYRVLWSPQGERLRHLVGGKPQQIAKTILWLKEHFKRPVLVEELAEIAKMGRAVFHRQFKDVTGLSPIQYQKRLRLFEAKRLLIADQTTAAQAAQQVGYASASQFSRDYRRFFGQSPRKDTS